MEIGERDDAQLEPWRPARRRQLVVGDGETREWFISEGITTERHDACDTAAENLEKSAAGDHSIVLLEQPELRSLHILRWLHSQMFPRDCGQNTAAWRALNETLLDHVGLDNVLDRVARFGKASGNGF